MTTTTTTTQSSALQTTNDHDNNDHETDETGNDQQNDAFEAPAWHNVLSGGVAGLGARMCTAPLDLIRIRRQLTPRSAYPQESLWQSWTTVVRTEGGITALFRGNLSAIYLWVGYSAVQFSLYNSTRDALIRNFDPRREYPSATAFCAGAHAGTWATLLTYPFDVCRTTFAAQGMMVQQQRQQPAQQRPSPEVNHLPRQAAPAAAARPPPSSASSTRVSQPLPFSSLLEPSYKDARAVALSSRAVEQHICAGRLQPPLQPTTETKLVGSGKYTVVRGPPKTIMEFSVLLFQQKGLAGFYTGATPAVLQIIPYMGISFTIYDALTADDHRVGLSAYAGSISGAASKMIVYPMDTVKRRLQGQALATTTAMEGQRPAYAGMWDCIIKILRQEGVHSFYRGMVPSVLKTTISSSLTFAFFRFSKNVLEAVHTGNWRHVRPY